MFETWTLCFKFISTASPCSNTDFSELKTQAVTVKERWGGLETEDQRGPAAQTLQWWIYSHSS